MMEDLPKAKMETILMIHACSGAVMGKWAVRNAINVELLMEVGAMFRSSLRKNRRFDKKI